MDKIFNYNFAISNINEYLVYGEKGILNLISSNYNNPKHKLNINGFILNPLKDWYVNNFDINSEINYLYSFGLSDEEEESHKEESNDTDNTSESNNDGCENVSESNNDGWENVSESDRWDNNISESNNDGWEKASESNNYGLENDSEWNNDKWWIKMDELETKMKENKKEHNFHVNLFKNQYNNYIIYLYQEKNELISIFIELACEFNNIFIFKYLIKYVNVDKHPINFKYYYILKKNNLEIFKHIVENGYHHKYHNLFQSYFFSLFNGSIDKKKFELTKYIFSMNLCKTQLLIYDAVKTKNVDIIKLVYEQGPKIERDEKKYKNFIDNININNDPYIVEYYKICAEINDSYQDFPEHLPSSTLCELASGNKQCIEYLNSIGFY